MKRNVRLTLVLLLALPLLFTSTVSLQAAKSVSFKPSVDYKTFVVDKAVKRAQKRERVIKILLDLLKNYPESEAKARLQVRLAELYLDKARHLFFLELYKNDPEAQKILKGEITLLKENAGKGRKALTDSYAYNREAIGIYRSVLKRYPRIKGRDEIYFYLAYNLGEIGRLKEAQRIYAMLIKRFKRSKLVPDAYLVQGEYLFNAGLWRRALAYYQRVLRYRESKVRNLAEYKIAWCLFNMKRTAQGIRRMEAVIGKTDPSGDDLGLRDEAIRDLVVMFSYGGYYKEAPLYFKQVGGKEHYQDMIKRLAGLYFKQGKNRYAKATYERFIKEFPDDKQNPEFQKRLVEIAQRIGRKEDVIVEASKLVRFYGESSSWSSKNRADWVALQSAKDLSESTLRKIALSLHNEAQKTKDERTYKLANASYREYLDFFPDTSHANKIRFFYAESLYKLKRLEEAGVEYSRVVRDSPKTAYARQAAYGAIVSYDELIGRRGVKGRSSGKDPISLPLWERELVRVSDDFVKYFPKEKRASQIAFKAAKVLYDYNQFQQAVQRFDQVVQDYPKSGAATVAANLVLDSWNIQEKWAQVVKWGKRYYANKALPGGKFKRDLYLLIEKSSFKVCQSMEQSSRHLEAASCYLAFAGEFKRSSFTDDAVNNAAVSYAKAKDTANSVATFERLVKSYPKSRHLKKALLAIGKGYEDMARFRRAASYYEAFQKRYPSDKQAADLIYNAALFRENIGNIPRAIQNYQIYVARYGKRKDAALTEYAIPLLYEKLKNWQEAGNAYRRLATKNRANPDLHLAALGKWGNMLWASGDKTAAIGVHKKLLAERRKLGKRRLSIDSIDLVGEAAFRVADSTYAQYMKVKLRLPLERFARDVRRKIRLLDSLIAEYQKVVDHGADRWLVRSIYRMAAAYDDLSLQLDGIKAPDDLSEEERLAFAQQMQEISSTMKARATEAYRNCIAQAAARDVFDNDVNLAADKLADISADTQRQLTEVIHTSIYVNDILGEGATL